MGRLGTSIAHAAECPPLLDALLEDRARPGGLYCLDRFVVDSLLGPGIAREVHRFPLGRQRAGFYRGCYGRAAERSGRMRHTADFEPIGRPAQLARDGVAARGHERPVDEDAHLARTHPTRLRALPPRWNWD